MKQLVAFCWLPCEVILDSARIEQHNRDELFRSIVIGTAVIWEKHESLWKGFAYVIAAPTAWKEQNDRVREPNLPILFI
jgi:hypothetical protein